jgi:hypothetical protein
MKLKLSAIVRIGRRVWLGVARLELAVLAIGAIAILGLALKVEAQEVCVEGSEDAAADEECIVPRPTPARLRPTFSEEDERGLQPRSLADSFLGDALTGMADPLGGGGGIGGDVDGEMTIDELEPGDRGLILEPGFDPTDVIIPLDMISK